MADGDAASRAGHADATRLARAWLRAAVATPSPSGAEDAVVRRLLAETRGRFDRAYRDDAGNLIAERGDGPRVVCVLGHVDTVPGDVPVEVRDGLQFGRGAVDAKGPLCSALAAAACLDDAAAHALTVRVVGAVGEEAPGSPGARHAAATLPAPDLLIIAEPSGWDAVTLGYKGHVRLEATCERPSGHAAGPDASAADRIVAAVERIRVALGDPVADAATDAATDPAADPPARGAEGGAFDRLQVTVLDLRHEHDGLRERASATIGVRLPPAWPPDRLEGRLAATPLPAGVDLRTVEAVPAVRAPRDGPLVRAFRTAVRQEGGTPRTVVKTGTSDWNVVADAWPVPTLAYGPGDAALDHAPDERVPLAHVDAATRVLGRVLVRLAAASTRPSTTRGTARGGPPGGGRTNGTGGRG